MAKGKGETVIADALARAIYDCPLHVLRTLNKHGFQHSSAMEIARRMVRELDHAGWRVKSAARREVMDLEDGITFGLSMADCVRLASESPTWSKEARDQATRCICAALSWRKVVLVRKVGEHDRKPCNRQTPSPPPPNYHRGRPYGQRD